jgi:ABC-type phosphate/phosphonate transport system substrate-binding protein
MKNAPMGLCKQILMFLIVVFLDALVAIPGSLGAESVPHPPDTTHVIRIASMFDAMPGVDIEESRMAFEMLMRNVVDTQRNRLGFHLEFIMDFNQAAKKIIAGHYDIVVLSGMDYLQIRSKTPLMPKLVISKVDQPTETLALVTQRNQTLESLQLKDPRILIIDAGRAGEVGKLWLDTVLLEAGLKPSEHFFVQIRRSQKPSRSILPVFFGQVAACVVSENAFKLMNELNPQIDQRVQILKRSQNLVPLLICTTPWADQEDIRLIVAEAVKANTNPKSRQALTMIHMSGFFLFRTEHLVDSEALYERYRLARKRWNR